MTDYLFVCLVIFFIYFSGGWLADRWGFERVGDGDRAVYYISSDGVENRPFFVCEGCW